MKKIIPLLVLCSLFCLSCLNNVEDITGEAQNDVSFSADVLPILNSCNTCHGNGQNGFNSSSYQAIINGTSTSYGSLYVLQGNPDNSPLVDKLEPNPENGSRMPQGGPFLSGNEIETIKAWIREGALNN